MTTLDSSRRQHRNAFVKTLYRWVGTFSGRRRRGPWRRAGPTAGLSVGEACSRTPPRTGWRRTGAARNVPNQSRPACGRRRPWWLPQASSSMTKSMMTVNHYLDASTPCSTVSVRLWWADTEWHDWQGSSTEDLRSSAVCRQGGVAMKAAIQNKGGRNIWQMHTHYIFISESVWSTAWNS